MQIRDQNGHRYQVNSTGYHAGARNVMSGRTAYSKGILSKDSSSARANAQGNGRHHSRKGGIKVAKSSASRDLQADGFAVELSPHRRAL